MKAFLPTLSQQGFDLLPKVTELAGGQGGSGSPAFWISVPSHPTPQLLNRGHVPRRRRQRGDRGCCSRTPAGHPQPRRIPPLSPPPSPASLVSVRQLSALFLCCAYFSRWPPCPIPSSAVFSFTLHEFYSQSINKPIIIKVLYSRHISSSVINHFMQEPRSLSRAHSSLFLSQ